MFLKNTHIHVDTALIRPYSSSSQVSRSWSATPGSHCLHLLVVYKHPVSSHQCQVVFGPELLFCVYGHSFCLLSLYLLSATVAGFILLQVSAQAIKFECFFVCVNRLFGFISHCDLTSFKKGKTMDDMKERFEHYMNKERFLVCSLASTSLHK